MKIQIELPAYRKLRALITGCTTEIMGLGKVVAQGNDTIIVKDVAIIKQDATGASAEFDQDALIEFMQERQKAKDISSWRLWWHSHAGMGTFWSSIDTDNIEAMGSTAEWMVSLVFNHDMDVKGRIDIHRPLRITQEDVPVETLVDYPPEVENWAKKEIDDKVKTPQNFWNREDKKKDIKVVEVEVVIPKKDGEPLINPQSIADKITSGQQLTLDEQAYYNKNNTWIDDIAYGDLGREY